MSTYISKIESARAANIQLLLKTHNAIPTSTKPIPIHVSLPTPFPSAHHSPSTVNKNAREFVIGTVRLNSAFPMRIKNHTLPVILRSRGIAYAGRDKTPMKAYQMVRIFLRSHGVEGEVSAGREGGV